MTQNSSSDFIARGAAAPTAPEGILPRERHTPAPPAPGPVTPPVVPADSGSVQGGPQTPASPTTGDPATVPQGETKAPVPPAEGILPRERHTPAPPAPGPVTPPTTSEAPTPPVTPPAGSGDGAPVTTDGAATPTAPSSEPSANEEIVTMERHTPAPPRPQD
ncbi:hypothetical protein [Streptomyces qinzhouensis]|uniref:Uncharacterized protein n=1 Tax=Streptomyces qinzhouensis TaxID=2599401 RepID=A0A5B8JBR2_9ACTN|nr:hypothetical protein [Streptomyces qinzhouensis]QDY77331.1 hypothetical protein FQU76_13280 [Streptomyces qinzhouensis]